MAKFGIALGSGPRGLGFESRHSDQKMKRAAKQPFSFFGQGGIRKAGISAHTGAKTVQWTVFRPWENPLISGRIREDVNRNQSSPFIRLLSSSYPFSVEVGVHWSLVPIGQFSGPLFALRFPTFYVIITLLPINHERLALLIL